MPVPKVSNRISSPSSRPNSQTISLLRTNTTPSHNPNPLLTNKTKTEKKSSSLPLRRPLNLLHLRLPINLPLRHPHHIIPPLHRPHKPTRYSPAPNRTNTPSPPHRHNLQLPALRLVNPILARRLSGKIACVRCEKVALHV